jgi:hypothetical protein
MGHKITERNEKRAAQRRGRKLTAGDEEGLQERSRVSGEDAGSDLDLMIQLGVGEQLEAGTESAAFGVVGGVDETGNPRLNDRTGAHGARFEGDVEDGASKAIVAEEARGFPKDDDFGVSGRVVIANSAIARACQGGIVVDENSADGDFADVSRGAGFVESELHIVEVVRHGRNEKSLTQSLLQRRVRRIWQLTTGTRRAVYP